jgi:hypothetical protein
VAVVLTPVQTKQIRINIHKETKQKTQYKQYKTINTIHMLKSDSLKLLEPSGPVQACNGIALPCA